jgi:hypothetical protein
MDIDNFACASVRGQEVETLPAEDSCCGHVQDHVALDAESRLVLSVVVGKRTEANATQVAYAMRERTDGRPRAA